MGLFVASCIAEEAGHSLKHSHFLPWMKSWSEMVFLGTELYHLEKEVTWVKSYCSPTLFYFSLMLYWNFSTGNLSSIKSLLSNNDYLKQCSPGTLGPQQRRLELVHESLQCPQLGPRSVCLLLDTRVSKIPFGSLAIGY